MAISYLTSVAFWTVLISVTFFLTAEAKALLDTQRSLCWAQLFIRAFPRYMRGMTDPLVIFGAWLGGPMYFFLRFLVAILLCAFSIRCESGMPSLKLTEVLCAHLLPNIWF